MIMSVTGACHCGAVEIELAVAPLSVSSCNCSLCRKLGWLLAYYPETDVRIKGPTRGYIWGDRMIGIHHCPTCGCSTHWRNLDGEIGRMGVNARLIEGFDPSLVETRFPDNAGPD